MSGLLFQRPKYTDKAPRQFSFKGVYVINILLSFRNELGTQMMERWCHLHRGSWGRGLSKRLMVDLMGVGFSDFYPPCTFKDPIC